MANYIAQSPWMVGDDASQVVSRLMVQLQQLRMAQQAQQQQGEYQQGMLGMRQQEMQAQQPLLDARTGQANEAAALSKARAGEITKRGDVAQDAGLAQFANLMSGVQGYNPQQTSMLPATPDVQQALARALLGQALTQSAATSPTAAASMLRPVELNRDTDLVNQLTGSLLAEGPRTPQRPITLGPQTGAYNPESGQQIAFNAAQRAPATPPDPTLQLSRILTGMESMQNLGLDEQQVVEGGKTNYVPTQAFQGLGRSLDPLTAAIIQAFSKTNTASAPSGQPVRVNTKAERDALAPGTQYIGPDGKTATKQ